jgi:hypothetical protein
VSDFSSLEAKNRRVVEQETWSCLLAAKQPFFCYTAFLDRINGRNTLETHEYLPSEVLKIAQIKMYLGK